MIMNKYLICWAILLVSSQFCSGKNELNLRPPAVPLVAHDPYFSIWSAADKLTDVNTTHWTGKPHPLGSTVSVDGKSYRLMGTRPDDTPALPQVSVKVLPTRTIYGFANEQVKVTLTFTTPSLPDDLEVLSRPATYISWDVVSADGKPHAVHLDVGCGGELAVNIPQQEVVWDKPAIEGFTAWRVGAKVQKVLGRKGDDLRIEWGYAYLAAANDQKPGAGKEGILAFDLGQVCDKVASRYAMIAYDDLYSINYFSARLRPYWRRNGAEMADALKAAAKDHEKLAVRCEKFDADLMADLARVGGERYALLCALAYRQTFAGNKLAADANGKPMLFPKENFSNGCISTVDVLFPQAPFFLVFSPAFTKAMLVPVLDYAASPRWKYDYAPHDLGTYPFATGQVYGMGGGDGGRMPLEESGNMLIIMAALAKIEGNVDFAKKYWPLLAKWADYCVREGLDPQNQLCSADMFGHMPRASNLALKAIIGIGGYAQLCEMAGKKDEAKKYMAIARDYITKWQELSKGEGRTLLAYGKPDTWAMKHNMIWDRVVGINIVPQAVADAEIAWYLKVQKKYGLPVDNRTDTSLIDWALWSIAPARDQKDFEALLEPIFRYANETESRVPLSDWFNTVTGKKTGFQARPVVGGIFVKLLADDKTWTAWAKKAESVSGDWAAFPGAEVVDLAEVIPTAKNLPTKWKYTLEKSGEDWIKAEFDDSAWKSGPAGFGTAGTPGAVVRTTWNTKDIWLRMEFLLSDNRLNKPHWRVHYDEDATIYLNGMLAAELQGWTTDYEDVPMTAEAKTALKMGKNVLAVHCQQTTGGQYVDVGISAVVPGAPQQQPAPEKKGPPAGLRKLMDTPIRDPSICRGPDGVYYLTGTSEPFWGFNNENGIRVWKSNDLVTWEPLGTVWRYGESPWHEPYLKVKKPIWAPEIHYMKGTFWITYSIPGWRANDPRGTDAKNSGCGLLKSTSGKAEGPYVDVQPGERMGDEIDASLFEDDDGKVYFLWHSGKIALMKPDMSGLAEPYRWLRTTTTDPEPKHHSGLCAGIFGKGSFDHVGYEGMFLFKEKGVYYLCCSDMIDGRYSCVVSTSMSIYGPYGERYEAIPHGGHNSFFRDDKGQLWSTYFGPPHGERASILPVHFDDKGRIVPGK